MRPEVLYPLFAPLTTLPGVGPRIAQQIARVSGPHVLDLFWHLPTGVIDRRFTPKIRDAPAGRIVTLTVTVDGHRAPPPHNKRVPYKVRCSDETGDMQLVFFHARPDYLGRVLPLGAQRIVSGMAEYFGGELQMTHPDFIAEPGELDRIKTVQPSYRLTAGLSLKVLGKAIQTAVENAPGLPEWLDPAFVARNAWPPWREAVRAAHSPAGEPDLEPTTPARTRLAYDELLASQLAVALVRASARRQPGREIRGDGSLSGKALAALGFVLTSSQRRAVDDILTDMGAPIRMLRLLQGDVGSGKTVVAFLAMLAAAEAGKQAALMAPTDVLARQHHATIKPLADAVGIPVALLTGREKGKARSELTEALEGGEITLAVGTHALFQEGIGFHDLALAVIDEQHRFGVHQRMLLTGKGPATDVLVMTATPIPRTLMLAAYGDLDESQLTEKPAGRKPIDTRAVPVDRLDEVVGAVGRALEGGNKVYWVCPLVDETESGALVSVTERFAALKARFGDRVGLVHGRLKGREKDAVMRRFTTGGVDLLVATTVIEVGVDVPEATVMIIEDSERFGLAQLHQLRGRIGRGERPSTCILLYTPPLSVTARARLTTLRGTDDGFRIAEEDLRLRGAGDVLGTRQSGLPAFRLADLAVHAELLAAARDDARLIVSRDPRLEGERGPALRVLLYLFERDAVVKYARAG
ncbi:MAG: ATP-dependent DNA helicase RecG [Alphaproteobacteria bacterium]